ncbi:MAG: TipAS antibiotic-recognition domain-containing protein [Microbacteriaceae bacterium]
MREFETSAQHQSINHGYTAEQAASFKAQHDEIASSLGQLMVDGATINDALVQEWIGKHYAFVAQFWTPTRTAYKSLALTYVLDPAFKSNYEAHAEGLAKFVQQSINIWADANLND